MLAVSNFITNAQARIVNFLIEKYHRGELAV